jgi:uncharacterized iron-regulated membrane protein
VYHRSRALHRWIGLGASLFLFTLAVTGFLLATKNRIAWVRPAAAVGGEIVTEAEIVTIEAAVQAAYAVGLAELKTLEDIDRVDYRPGDNIFKILSKEGYHEVQVDGKTGRVLSVNPRRDQFIEDIHDMSFFSDALHDWGLPTVGLCLATLAATGIGLFFTPVVRRWRFRHKNPNPPK